MIVQYVALAGVVTVFPMLVTMLFRSFQFNTKQLADQQKRIENLERKNVRCEWRLQKVAQIVSDLGGEIPREIWFDEI